MPTSTIPAAKAVIGMVHLRPLPGSPAYRGDMNEIIRDALSDALALQDGGVDAIMIENYGDLPFFKTCVPAATVAAMTAAIIEIRSSLSAIRDTPVGVNVLRNDACAALSIACATGAKLIRVNVLTGARVTDQGVIEGAAAELARLKRMLGATDVKILADIDVKHSAPLAARPLEEEVADTADRGGADGLIVSGTGTGKPTDPAMAKKVRAAAPNMPLYVGSGVTVESVGSFMDHVDGFIVGTHFKHNGKVNEPVDPERVRAFVKKVKG
jgi:membrane complex biogenesis BtpA family protein